MCYATFCVIRAQTALRAYRHSAERPPTVATMPSNTKCKTRRSTDIVPAMAMKQLARQRATLTAWQRVALAVVMERVEDAALSGMFMVDVSDMFHGQPRKLAESLTDLLIRYGYTVATSSDDDDDGCITKYLVKFDHEIHMEPETKRRLKAEGGALSESDEPEQAPPEPSTGEQPMSSPPPGARRRRHLATKPARLARPGTPPVTPGEGDQM